MNQLDGFARNVEVGRWRLNIAAIFISKEKRGSECNANLPSRQPYFVHLTVDGSLFANRNARERIRSGKRLGKLSPRATTRGLNALV